MTNPIPGGSDYFGRAVAAVGSDQLLIAAPNDSTGATNAGSVYLFNIAPAGGPMLTIQILSTNTVVISWPSPSTGFTLQENTNGIATMYWSNVTDIVQDDGTNRALIITPPTDNRYFRLFK